MTNTLAGSRRSFVARHSVQLLRMTKGGTAGSVQLLRMTVG
jgi:hypothetical protein